jgi:hypothetical protein
VGYVHREQDGTHLFFLSNLSDQGRQVTVTFKDRTEPARAWSVNDAAPMPLAGEGAEHSLYLPAHGSAVVVFAPDLADAPQCALPTPKTNERTLKNWTLTVDGRCFTATEPVSWETLPGVEHFCGAGVYECTFEAEGTERDALLCLSGLSAAARVSLNGQPVGDVWTHPLELRLGDLQPGENHLRVEVYSTLVNEMMLDGSYEACPEVLPEWPYYGTVINVQRKARLNCMREYTEQKERLQSGLWGSVTLRW